MGNVTESIFKGFQFMIPLKDVLYVDWMRGNTACWVVLKGTSWDNEADNYINAPSLYDDDAQRFVSEWCRYRVEIEKDDSKDLSPDPDMYRAMQEFVDRVDSGEVRSVKTYNKFKGILAKARGES